ncbi:hypothetical protein BpHYR1_020558 [Brachionus plicatilis]|uniref:Uncharacterized protein n=1 Tax=Brachionus plicatilis TaxID=10195 RepID=A0A3M7S7U0_BRAPC|nr:hypothetical protein BpHYR1_020558 [Brachionus plicatilis]
MYVYAVTIIVGKILKIKGDKFNSSGNSNYNLRKHFVENLRPLRMEPSSSFQSSENYFLSFKIFKSYPIWWPKFDIKSNETKNQTNLRIKESELCVQDLRIVCLNQFDMESVQNNI